MQTAKNTSVSLHQNAQYNIHQMQIKFYSQELE